MAKKPWDEMAKEVHASRAAARARRGPEPLPGTADQKSTVSVRISPDLKDKLVAATRTNDRSLSQEAEIRLEQSFKSEALAAEVLTLLFGRPLAGLILLVGNVMRASGTVSGIRSAGSRVAFSDDWHADPYAFDQAYRAAIAILEAARPPGDPTKLDDGTDTTKSQFLRDHGVRMAINTLMMTKAGDRKIEDAKGRKIEEPAAELARSLLGKGMLAELHIPEWPERPKKGDA
jgi:hypothetical protein